MDDAQILGELLEAGAISEPRRDSSGSWLRDSASRSEGVSIKGLPDDAIILRADRFPQPDGIFRGARGERKRADFIMICPSDSVILFVEMKDGTDDRQVVVSQLRGARCLLTYLRSVGREFWQEPNFLAGYVERFLCIRRTTRARKRATRDGSLPAGRTPHQFCPLEGGGTFHFSQLTGRPVR